MMCTTGLHGGVCHRTSTPLKSRIKMKKKKKKKKKNRVAVEISMQQCVRNILYLTET